MQANTSYQGKWIIYGAYGYSGELIARKAKAMGLSPILAGRNQEKLEKLSNELGLERAVFSLDDEPAALKTLSAAEAVVNCAGPFAHTFEKMIHYCLQSQTHYLDITGEISVFERARALNDQAKEKGIVICPGAGFDVVPTDCLAKKLKQLLPDAERLALGFQGMTSTSAGTAKTTVEGLAGGGKVRVNGEIKTVPFGSVTRRVNFGKGERLSMAIPWGDVSTAYFSTGIPNIEVYVPASKGQLKALRFVNLARPLLKSGLLQTFLKKQIEKKVKGPDERQRSEQKSLVWGEAKDAQGNKKVLRLQTANGYDLTSQAPVEIIKKFLSEKGKHRGYHTPSTLMGADFVTELDGTGDWQED